MQIVKPQFWKENLKSWLPVVGQLVVLLVVALMLLWPAPFTSNQLFASWPTSDLEHSHWPFALLIQRTLMQTHQLPFWNPYFGGGQPVNANPLAALFYPPTLLVYFFSIRNYFLLLILGHLLFAGLGMLLLARYTLKLSRFSALVAAVSYMATPRLISHLGAGHVTIVQTVAWFPWLALACWATVCVSWRWGALLGVCIGLMLLAGHPQMAYYGLLLVTGLSVWLLIRQWRVRRWRFASLASLAAAGVIGVLLAGVYLLPLLELTAHSTRQVSLASTDAFTLSNLLHALFFLPSPSGLPWEGIISPGLIVFALALLAIVIRWHRSWPLVLGTVLIALLAMGNASLFYVVISRILPEFNRFRAPARIWFVALLLIALLAGIGTDWLLYCVKRISFHELPTNFRTVATMLAGCLILLIVAYPLVVTDMSYSRTDDVRAITTPSTLARTVASLAGSGRSYDEQTNISQTSAVQLQVRLADGWDPLLLESYVAYMERAGSDVHSGYTLSIPYRSPSAQPDATLLGWMNVSIVVSRRQLTDPHFVQVGVVDGTLIYKNTADAGAAYLVEPGANNDPPALSDMKRLNAQVRVTTFAPEQKTFTFSSPTSAYLVIATPMFPGWTAKLDERPVPVQLIGQVMPAIKVGKGTHTLRYRYTPSYVFIGAVLSVAGIVATLAWLLAGYYVRPGRRFGFDGAKKLNGKQHLKA